MDILQIRSCHSMCMSQCSLMCTSLSMLPWPKTCGAPHYHKPCFELTHKWFFFFFNYTIFLWSVCCCSFYFALIVTRFTWTFSIVNLFILSKNVNFLSNLSFHEFHILFWNKSMLITSWLCYTRFCMMSDHL
jgi:hypothetical protein